VVLSLVLVNLVHGDGGVDNGWLDRFLLDNWLDILVDMVVDMLTCDVGVGRCGVLSATNFAGILELGLLGRETFLYVLVVAVLDVAVLNASHLVAVLFWEYLTVLDGLNGGVVVILVDLTVDRCGDILMSCGSNRLVLNRGVDGLVDGGIMLSISVEEVSNCCLCLIHFD